ncbi:hypothetical protein [Morganella morganii]|uniref:hypothetical protein n=1 Tax=Morganella morganii TaxID=582 RepID=UPI0034D74F97
MSITKEQWAGIEESLKSHYVRIKFFHHGTYIQVTRVSTGEGKTELAVYLDGVICVGWGFPDGEHFNPLCELFWHQRNKSYYTPKQIKDCEKALGKRQAKKTFPKLHQKLTYYTPYFSKASVLVRQFRRIDGLTVTGEVL